MSRREEIVRLCDDWDKLDPRELADAILALPPVETSELVKRLEAADEVIGGVALSRIRHSDGGVELAAAVVRLKAAAQNAAAALVQQEAEIARLSSDVTTYREYGDRHFARAEKAEQERDEYKRGLVEIDRFKVDPQSSMVNNVFRIKNMARAALSQKDQGQ